ncbi:putative Serine/threonine-protein phosphatase 2B catalytic subunit [Paratrimastix pyriformis]|uniref:Serine/threonine-protein phosphatase n=1 Tax=Paratrimastix pyriformis TaxID=342808 RepID=A0ABQ8UF39_9EUKA|nr:putative Serine/threonine-protein phosphatase 2B catalytic subunit [Paratrimastix pyriformis]
MKLVRLAADAFRREPNVVVLSGETRVCGDLHGQYFDFLKLLEVGGDPGTPSCSYLFMGDFVDRGSFGLELIIHLFALKVSYPDNFFLLRGNHESAQLTDHFNFKKECLYKYDLHIYEAILGAFCCLPIAALCGERRFFCVHGGLSPDIKKACPAPRAASLGGADTFRSTGPPRRSRTSGRSTASAKSPRVGPSGLATFRLPFAGLTVASSALPPGLWLSCSDLLWSDPLAVDESGVTTFVPNSTRNCGYFFGLVAIVRAHEAKAKGYEMHYRRTGESSFPTVITVFSAPNYVDTFQNQGAILLIKNDKVHFRQFGPSPHPSVPALPAAPGAGALLVPLAAPCWWVALLDASPGAPRSDAERRVASVCVIGSSDPKRPDAIRAELCSPPLSLPLVLV